MRLAFDVQTGVGGLDTGVGRVTQSLRRSLPSAGAVVLEVRRQGDTPIRGSLERAVWEWLQLPARAAATGAAALLSPGFSARAPKGMPLAIVVHDLLPFKRPAELGRRNGWYWRGLVPASWRRAALRICVSEATRQDLEARVPGIGRTVAIPNGVDERLVPEGPAAGGDYLLIVGAWPPRKNAITAARAVAATPGAPPLRVVGGMPSHGRKELTSVLGERVIFEGYLTNRRLVALYRGARAVLAPSAGEGYGLAPVEGAACGSPVLMSDIRPHREALPWLSPYGRPDDHAALAAALESCMEDPAPWRAPSAWRPRTWREAAADYVAAIREIL